LAIKRDIPTKLRKRLFAPLENMFDGEFLALSQLNGVGH